MARSLHVVLAIALLLGFLSSGHSAVVPVLAQPTWAELTLEQKQVLAPLAAEWNALEVYRQKKWLGIAQRYSALTPDEQARVQRRMKAWVKLSPEERKAAREKFKKLNKAAPDRKEAIMQKWQEYKELPDQDRLKLQEQTAKAKAHTKPATKPMTPLTPPPTSALVQPPSLIPTENVAPVSANPPAGPGQ